MPLLFTAVILLAHSRHPATQENLDISLFVPFKDLLVMGTMYIIAIRYRNDINIHARAMVATGIVFIEPVLVRAVSNLNIVNDLTAYLITIGVVYALLLVLIIKERKQKEEDGIPFNPWHVYDCSCYTYFWDTHWCMAIIFKMIAELLIT